MMQPPCKIPHLTLSVMIAVLIYVRLFCGQVDVACFAVQEPDLPEAPAAHPQHAQPITAGAGSDEFGLPPVPQRT